MLNPTARVASRTVGLLLAAMATGAGAVWAQAPAATQASPPESVARCDDVQQDRAACVREAGAARQEAQRHGLTSASPATYESNALARCRLQPPADRPDCEARVRGTGATSSGGSVMGGGVIRETVTPAPAPTPAR